MNYNLPEYKDMKEEDLPSEFKSPVPDGVKWTRIEELEQTVYLLRHWRNSEDKKMVEKNKTLEITEKVLSDKVKMLETEISSIKNNMKKEPVDYLIDNQAMKDHPETLVVGIASKEAYAEIKQLLLDNPDNYEFTPTFSYDKNGNWSLGLNIRFLIPKEFKETK